MSVAKQLKHDKEFKSRKRRTRQKVEVTWNDVDEAIIRDFLDFAERVNGAVRFGRSRDGAVYSLGFYVGDERFTEWIRNDHERDSKFADLAIELQEDYALEDDVPDPYE